MTQQAPDREAVPEKANRLGIDDVEFVESAPLHPEDRGALTRTALGSVSFELVHQVK